jgi:hypothetical protein
LQEKLLLMETCSIKIQFNSDRYFKDDRKSLKIIKDTHFVFNNFDFKKITNEFAAVLWSLTEGDLKNLVLRNAFGILVKVIFPERGTE